MQVRWKVTRTPQGYAGTIEWEDRHGYLNATTMSAASKDKALGRAAAMASKLAEHPAVQAILPPGGGAALKALGTVAKSDQARKAFRYLSRLV